MKTEIEFDVKEMAGDHRKAIITYLPDIVLQQYGPKVLESVMIAIRDRIVQEWWDRHSAELLEQLAPGAMAQAISDKLKAEIAKRVLGGGERG